MQVLERLKRYNRKSHPKHVPKYGSDDFVRWVYNRPDFGRFPPAPCQWLCRRPKIRRFHFTCLTCSDRRHYFNTWRSKHLKEYKKIIMVMEPAAGRRFFLPERYMSYGIIIPVNERGLVNPLKAGFVKVLMTIAERIAEF